MKFKFLLTLLLIIPLLSLSVKSQSNPVDVSVKLQSVNMLYNNSVGNEWSYSASINGQTLSTYSSKKFKLSNEDPLVDNLRVVERDKISDVGTGTIKFRLSDFIDKSSINKTADVIVRENRGRYSGNTAKWRFIVEVSKQ